MCKRTVLSRLHIGCSYRNKGPNDVHFLPGSYAYLRKGSRDQSHTADLTSPPLCGAASVTVSFTYVITHPSCELRVLTQCRGHEAGGDTIKYIAAYSKTWQRKNFTLPPCPHSDVTVRTLDETQSTYVLLLVWFKHNFLIKTYQQTIAEYLQRCKLIKDAQNWVGWGFNVKQCATNIHEDSAAYTVSTSSLTMEVEAVTHKLRWTVSKG